jgi:cation:H+ antiporter
MVWIEFSIASFFVILFGYLLTNKADKFADAKNIGKGLIGFILLGFSTSIPELVSTVSSTVIFNNPLLGSGNIIGSNNANIFILSISFILAATLRKKDGRIDGESLISISFSFIITAVFLIAIVFSGAPFFLGHPVYCYLIFIVFAFSIFELHKINYREI